MIDRAWSTLRVLNHIGFVFDSFFNFAYFTDTHHSLSSSTHSFSFSACRVHESNMDAKRIIRYGSALMNFLHRGGRRMSSKCPKENSDQILVNVFERAGQSLLS